MNLDIHLKCNKCNDRKTIKAMPGYYETGQTALYCELCAGMMIVEAIQK